MFLTTVAGDHGAAISRSSSLQSPVTTGDDQKSRNAPCVAGTIVTRVCPERATPGYAIPGFRKEEKKMREFRLSLVTTLSPLATRPMTLEEVTTAIATGSNARFTCIIPGCGSSAPANRMKNLKRSEVKDGAVAVVCDRCSAQVHKDGGPECYSLFVTLRSALTRYQDVTARDQADDEARKAYYERKAAARKTGVKATLAVLTGKPMTTNPAPKAAPKPMVADAEPEPTRVKGITSIGDTAAGKVLADMKANLEGTPARQRRSHRRERPATAPKAKSPEAPVPTGDAVEAK